MGGHQDCQPRLTGQSFQKARYLDAGGQVEKCSRFIKQHHGGLLGKSAGNHYSLALPVTQF